MNGGTEHGGDGGTAPARSVLLRAEAANRAAGHENLGFLSEGRGFMPLATPAPRLPDEFAAWDKVAGNIPQLLGSLRLRAVLDELPVLPATPDRLPDQALLRACHLLAMLAHAYQYVESQAPARLPPALTAPWSTVRRRLDRADADVLSYIDLIVYNFRLVDPTAPDPFRVENMRLLTPTVDTPEERIFYLTQTEILAQTAPIVGAIVRAQEAILADDADGLGRALALIGARLRHVVRTSLPKINPNPSAPSYVNPVVWAKTVAPFAVPMGKGVQGPSGTSSPLFNLLDVFFGRKATTRFLGKRNPHLRRGYPLHWRELLAAVGEVSTADYVTRRQDAALSGLWADAVDAYVGQDGFLGRHRMKVYGYLELAFKVGRSVTIGGFAGLFKDRTWDQVDGELEYARRERLESFPESCRRGAVRPTPEAAPDGTGEAVRRVVLDVDGAGLRYEPGDRCGVLAENGDEIVARTLAALRAGGDEPIALTDEWRAHLALRPGFAGRTTLPLRELLRFGRIRPVVPRVAEALHARHAAPRPAGDDRHPDHRALGAVGAAPRARRGGPRRQPALARAAGGDRLHQPGRAARELPALLDLLGDAARRRDGARAGADGGPLALPGARRRARPRPAARRHRLPLPRRRAGRAHVGAGRRSPPRPLRPACRSQDADRHDRGRDGDRAVRQLHPAARRRAGRRPLLGLLGAPRARGLRLSPRAGGGGRGRPAAAPPRVLARAGRGPVRHRR